MKFRNLFGFSRKRRRGTKRRKGTKRRGTKKMRGGGGWWSAYDRTGEANDEDNTLTSCYLDKDAPDKKYPYWCYESM